MTRVSTTASGLTYVGYLRLDLLLAAQPPERRLRDHDEMVFIIAHQVVELLLKLVIHELNEARRCLAADDIDSAVAALRRVLVVLDSMIQQWAVLATLSAEAFARIRPALAGASGMQSSQFHAVEVLLGHGSPAADASVVPSVYHELTALVARRGFGAPTRAPELTAVLRRFLTEAGARPRELCDVLVQLSAKVQRWRELHVITAARLIGGLPGTGGTSGVAYLRRKAARPVFAELVAAYDEQTTLPARRRQ